MLRWKYSGIYRTVKKTFKSLTSEASKRIVNNSEFSLYWVGTELEIYKILAYKFIRLLWSCLNLAAII